MEFIDATEEQIKDFNYKLYLHHKNSRDIDFEYPKINWGQLSRYNKCVYVNNELVGFVSLKMYSEQYVELKRIYVNEFHRRKGIGTAILEKLFEDCEDYVIVNLKTYTYEGLKLFEKNGFKIININKNGSLIMEGIL